MATIVNYGPSTTYLLVTKPILIAYFDPKYF